MTPKVKVVQHANSIPSILRILSSQLIQDADLKQSLSVTGFGVSKFDCQRQQLYIDFDILEPIYIPDYLDGHLFSCFVVQGSDNLARDAPSDNFQDFVTIGQVIVQHLDVFERNNDHYMGLYYHIC